MSQLPKSELRRGEVNIHRYEAYFAEVRKAPIADARLLEAFRSRVLDLLSTLPDLVVQKVSLASRRDAMIEAKCTWTGADPDPATVEAALRTIWPGDLLGPESAWTWAHEDEVTSVRFCTLLTTPDSDEPVWAQGRVRIFP